MSILIPLWREKSSIWCKKKKGNVRVEKISRNIVKKGCLTRDLEKKKLKTMLKNVNKISVTIDM